MEQYLDISGGKIIEEVGIIEKKQTVIRNGKPHERIVKEKDINSLNNGVNVKSIERYNKEKTAEYQFVLFNLKKINIY